MMWERRSCAFPLKKASAAYLTLLVTSNN